MCLPFQAGFQSRLGLGRPEFKPRVKCPHGTALRVPHQPRRLHRAPELRPAQAALHPEPVVRPDTFADGAGVTIYGSVLHDSGKLRMWYHAIPQDWDYQTDMSSIAYAESDDGIHWTKPPLGILAHGPGPNHLTNLGLHSATVFIDPDSPPRTATAPRAAATRGCFSAIRTSRTWLLHRPFRRRAALGAGRAEPALAQRRRHHQHLPPRPRLRCSQR